MVALAECTANKPAETARAAKSTVATIGSVLVRFPWT